MQIIIILSLSQTAKANSFFKKCPLMFQKKELYNLTDFKISYNEQSSKALSTEGSRGLSREGESALLTFSSAGLKPPQHLRTV